MQSLISKEKKCYVCGTTFNIHKHHIWKGYNRKKSEDIGAWVYLCYKHHNGSNEGVHFNPKLDQELKQLAQRKYEEKHTRDEFMSIIKRNYLD